MNEQPTERDWLEGLRYEDKFPDPHHNQEAAESEAERVETWTIFVCPIHPDAVKSRESAPPIERPYCPHAKREDPHKMIFAEVVPSTALFHERQLREEAERERDEHWDTLTRAVPRSDWQFQMDRADIAEKRAETAERQLHEARTQVERLEKERDDAIGHEEIVREQLEQRKEGQGETRAKLRAAETQLKRCQEAGRKVIDAIDNSVAKGSWTPPIRAALDELRSALSQPTSPNTRETE